MKRLNPADRLGFGFVWFFGRLPRPDFSLKLAIIVAWIDDLGDGEGLLRYDQALADPTADFPGLRFVKICERV